VLVGFGCTALYFAPSKVRESVTEQPSVEKYVEFRLRNYFLEAFMAARNGLLHDVHSQKVRHYHRLRVRTAA